MRFLKEKCLSNLPTKLILTPRNTTFFSRTRKSVYWPVANDYQWYLLTLKLFGVSALKAKSSLGGLGIIKILLLKPNIVAFVCNARTPGAEAGLWVWGQLELPNKALPQKKNLFSQWCCYTYFLRETDPKDWPCIFQGPGQNENSRYTYKLFRVTRWQPCCIKTASRPHWMEPRATTQVCQTLIPLPY